MSTSHTTEAGADQHSNTEREVRENLPATIGELAERIGITQSAVRSRLHRMDGDDIQRGPDGVYSAVEPRSPTDGETHTDRDEHPQEQRAEPRQAETKQPPVRTDRVDPSSSKAAKSRATTEALDEIERQSANLLTEARERGDLAVKPQGNIGEVDVLIPRADDHFGDAGEMFDHDAGEVTEVFNLDIAVERVQECTLEAIERVTALSDVYDFGTCHFALLGDSVTGEDIFASQPHEIDAELREQIDTAADTYFEQIAVLADVFEHVHVPTVPGNHGEIRTGSASTSNNADDFVYDRLEAMVRVSDLDNVSFTRSWRAKFVNFEVRGWNVHARHGQDSLNHIGTSSGKNRWRGWLSDHKFDLGLRGHYHEKKREPVRGRPVLESGSISPPGDFEESISEWSPPGGMFYLIGDGERPLEASFDVHFG